MPTSSPNVAFGELLALVISAVVVGAILTGVLPIVTAGWASAFATCWLSIRIGFLYIPSFALSLVGMLGFIVSIDYALFIIGGYRQQLVEGYDL